MTPTPSSTPTAHRTIGHRQPSGAGVLLSAGDFAALMDELDSLRASDRQQRRPETGMRAAAELLTALRTAGVDETRVAQVTALVERASMVDDLVTIGAGAGIGSTVEVEDRGGRTTEYELVAATADQAQRLQVTLDTPTGKALLGARPGDFVRVTLPNGRTRRVRVRNVTPMLTGSVHATLGTT